MSTRKEHFVLINLPEDIVVRILCRLPVKSLIRFTCVSKRWRSIIISDPQFRKSHFQLACHRRNLTRRVLISTYPSQVPKPCGTDTQSHRLPSRFQSLSDSCSVNNLSFPLEENTLQVMASCNGLVLLGEYYLRYYKNLSIWNPSTRFFRKIPSSSFGFSMTDSNDGKKGYLGWASYGFGYVSSTDDYKLVLVVPAVGGFLEMHVFSLRADSWKLIKAPYSAWPGLTGGRGTYSNGAIHWLIGRRNGISDTVIYAFDLAVEEFRLVPLHVSYQNNLNLRSLVHLEGCLCVWSRKRNDLTVCECWAMREYGVPESWVKLFQISVNDLPDVASIYCNWDMCFVTEGVTVVIRMLDKELIWIECPEGEKPVRSDRYRFEEVPAGCKCYYDATVYDETLVSVPE
nr:MYB transcription factor protein [Rosa persica]